MRYLKTTMIIVLSFLFMSCQKENIERQKDTKFILFEPQFDVFGEYWTRGKPLDNVSDFGVFVYDNNNKFIFKEMNNSHVLYNPMSYGWDYSPVLEWDFRRTLNFFAYSPYNNDKNGIVVGHDDYSPYLKYTVPTTCVDQPDLMVAVPKKHIFHEPIRFEFEHALACVGFKVKGRFDEKITKIVVKGVSVSGTLSLDHIQHAPLWSDIQAATDTEYTSGIKDGIIAGNTLTDVMDADGYLMMIPQTLRDGAKLIVTVDGVDKEVSLSGKEWKAGERYTYNIDVRYDPIIIGYFGGWNGMEYTKLLQVDWEMPQRDKVSQWASFRLITNAIDLHYGPANTITLKNLGLQGYPAVKYCEDKGDGWYLPSYNQLVAIWIAYEGIPAKFSFFADCYWSSSESKRLEVSATHSWYVSFTNGYANDGTKLHPFPVRCVRDVPIY